MFDLSVFNDTTVEDFNFNRVILSGKIAENIQFVFETKKTRFYRTALCLRRNHNRKNYITILFNESILRSLDLKQGEYITVCGYIRSSDRIIFKEDSNKKETQRNTEIMVKKPDYVEKLIRFTDVFAMQIFKGEDVKRESWETGLLKKGIETESQCTDDSVGDSDLEQIVDSNQVTMQAAGKHSNGTDGQIAGEQSNSTAEQPSDLNLVEICGTVIQMADVKVLTYESEDSKVRHKKVLACSIKINPDRKDNGEGDKNSHFVVSCIFWGKIINLIKALPKNYSVRLIGKIEKNQFNQYHDWIDSAYVINSFLVTEIKHCD